MPSVAYQQAVATTLDRRDLRIFDYAKQFALPFREAIRARTEHLAAEEGVEIRGVTKRSTLRSSFPSFTSTTCSRSSHSEEFVALVFCAM